MKGRIYQKQNGALVDTTPKVVALRQYELCEIYYFLNPTLRPGFVQAAGGLISNAATLHPAAFQFLQTVEGQAMCVTESEWQALSTATYYTNASGQTEGWNGVGGVAKFVLDTANGTIRVPDLRGMYAEAAGLDSLTVGGVHADRIRNIWFDARLGDFIYGNQQYGGALTISRLNYGGHDTTEVSPNTQWNDDQVSMQSWRIVPTGNFNAPRAFGSLACVYLGS